MSFEKLKLSEAGIEIIDGDRGVNYPKQNEFFSSEYCLFLNAKNVTKDGFNFNEQNFITREKDCLLRKGKLERNDIVLTTRGTVGNVAFYNDKVPFNNIRINSGMVILRADTSKYISDFVYWMLRSNYIQNQIEAIRTGSAQPQLPITIMRNIEVVKPALSKQKVIAATISALDDTIELNNQINKKLEEMAQSIFKSWFVDFEPFKDEEFEESELGLIPKGWRVVNLPEMIAINPIRQLRRGTVASYVEMKNIPDNYARIRNWDNREYRQSGAKFKNGDVLMARITPCLENGKTAYVDFLAEREIGWGSTEYIVLAPKELISGLFIYFLARSEWFRDYAIASMTGTSGRQRVPTSCFDSYKITIPEKDVLNQFNLIVKTFFALMKKNDLESKILINIRDSLLPKLMSGEIRVPVEEVEQFV